MEIKMPKLGESVESFGFTSELRIGRQNIHDRNRVQALKKGFMVNNYRMVW